MSNTESTTNQDVKGDYIEESVSVWDRETKTFSDLTFKVYGVAEFARGKNGNCAFCGGDPCADNGEGLIAIYREASSYFDTCPICEGRPT